MSLEIATQDRQDYLAGTAKGKWPLEDLKELVRTVRLEADQRGYTCVLLD